MGPLAFYLLAFLPLIAGAAFWYFDKHVAWFEALLLCALGFVVASLFHYSAIRGMTDDIETWSGTVVEATYQPAWTEYYEEAVYRTETYTETEEETVTNSKGEEEEEEVTVTKTRQVFDHWEPETRYHDSSWWASDTLVGEYSVDESRYNDIKQKFGNVVSPHNGTRSTMDHDSHMISGDPEDYTTVNKTAYVYPVITTKTWTNKVKACPSVFSYVKVDPDMVAKIFPYPKNDNRFSSDRLVGAGSWNITLWDQMNARLGAPKKVNVIAVNFGINADEDLATWQEALWIGGKKNDLVLCFGGGATVDKPTWCHTFGWTEEEIVKRDLDTIVVTNGIKPDTIPLIEKEIQANYKIKQWRKFDYLTVQIPTSYFVWSLVAQIVLIIAWALWANFNNVDKSRDEEQLLSN